MQFLITQPLWGIRYSHNCADENSSFFVLDAIQTGKQLSTFGTVLLFSFSSQNLLFPECFDPQYGDSKLLRNVSNFFKIYKKSYTRTVFLNRRAAARYRALASIISDRERSEETTICQKISLVKLITNLNVILYLKTCHTVYISVLILFMIMP